MAVPKSPQEIALADECLAIEEHPLIAELLTNGKCPSVIFLPNKEQVNKLDSIPLPKSNNTKGSKAKPANKSNIKKPKN